MDFVKLFFGRTDTEALRNAGKIRMQGDEKAIEMLRCCFEAADSNFKIRTALKIGRDIVVPGGGKFYTSAGLFIKL